MKTKSYKEWKRDAKKEFEERLNKEGALMIFLKFTLPFVLAFFAGAVFYSMGEEMYTRLLKLLGVYLFMPVGSGIGVPFSIGIGLDMKVATIFMLIVDALCSMFIIWNLDYVKLIPLLRRLVKRTEDKALELRKKYPWIKNLEFVGIIFFVFVPLYGTGSILGSIVGKLLRMNGWRIWVAVMIGSSLRILIFTGIVEGIFFLI